MEVSLLIGKSIPNKNRCWEIFQQLISAWLGVCLNNSSKCDATKYLTFADANEGIRTFVLKKIIIYYANKLPITSKDTKTLEEHQQIKFGMGRSVRLCAHKVMERKSVIRHSTTQCYEYLKRPATKFYKNLCE